MQDEATRLTINLPQSETVEVYTVELSDGTRVERTAAQLAKIPQQFRPKIVDFAPPKEAK